MTTTSIPRRPRLFEQALKSADIRDSFTDGIANRWAVLKMKCAIHIRRRPKNQAQRRRAERNNPQLRSR